MCSHSSKKSLLMKQKPKRSLRGKIHLHLCVLVLEYPPHLHDRVSSCRGHTLASRRPGYAVHSVSMAPVGEEAVPAAGIPHLHGLVKSCRGHTLASRRPGYAV